MRSFRLFSLIWLGLLATLMTTRTDGADFRVGTALAIEANFPASSIEGKVVLAGNVRRAQPLPVFKSRDYCGATVANETLLIDSDGGLKNAAVLLRPLA